VRDRTLARLLILPCALAILILGIFPLIYALHLSFHSWQLPSLEPQFVGLENYANILQDKRFYWAIVRSCFFVVTTVGIQFLLGFTGAFVLSRGVRGLRLIGSLLLAPVMIAPVAVGAIWLPLFDINFGLLNYCLGLIGLGKVEWLATPTNALPCLMLIDIWQWTPFMLLILLAGFQSIPREPLEAARIGGASEWRILRSISLPMLTPVIGIALLLRGIDSFGKFFDTAYLLTRGGPGTSSETLNLYIYEVGFKFFRLGYGAALSFTMLLLALVGIAVFFKVFRVE